MKICMPIYLFSFLLFYMNTAIAEKIVDINYQNPENKKVFQDLTLDNGMQVLLISDPDLTMSSAALDVKVGSLANPFEHQGIAHYLEHLLFLGTKKYPDPEEYKTFIGNHQGKSNAYTSDDSTNYHFEIDHKAFPEALERMALFFKEPLFSEKYVQKELEAVDSEFRRNYDRDSRRAHQVIRSLAKLGHPLTKFSTGSKETLKNTSVQDVRNFYEKNYSAHIMKLVLMSPLSIKELSQLATINFKDVRRVEIARQEIPTEIYEEHQLPMLVNIKPLKDFKSMSINFQLPKSQHLWKTSPVKVMSLLMNYQGEKSFASMLKNAGLITQMSASSYEQVFGTNFSVSMELTDKGLDQYKDILQHFFAFVQLLKKNGYPSYVYEDMKAIAGLNYATKSHYGGMEVARDFANAIQIYPVKDFEKYYFKTLDYNPEEYFVYLNEISPEKMLVSLQGKSLPTNKKEAVYQTEYSVEKIPEEFIANLKKFELHKDVIFPPKNPYVLKQTVLLEKSKNNTTRLLDQSWGDFYFEFDNKFKTPKTQVSFTILTPELYRSPQNYVLTNLYTQTVNKALEEWRYQISQAGVSFKLNFNNRGMTLFFWGYSENLPQVIEDVFNKLMTFKISDYDFEVIKQKEKEALLNSRQNDAYRQGLYELNQAMHPSLIHMSQYFDPENSVDLVSNVSLKDITKFSRQIYQEIALEGVALGNIDVEKLAAPFKKIEKILGAKILPAKKRPIEKWSKLPPKSKNIFAINSEVNNNAFVKFYQTMDLSFKNRALFLLGHTILSDKFFGDLRTQQQLGYIVDTWDTSYPKSLGLFVSIQSADYSPEVIDQKVNQWVQNIPKIFGKISDVEFFKIKQAAVTKLRQEAKNQSDALNNLYNDHLLNSISVKDYNKKLADEVSKISINQLISGYKKVLLDGNETSLSIYFYKKGKYNAESSPKNVRSDIFTFKKSLTEW